MIKPPQPPQNPGIFAIFCERKTKREKETVFCPLVFRIVSIPASRPSRVRRSKRERGQRHSLFFVVMPLIRPATSDVSFKHPIRPSASELDFKPPPRHLGLRPMTLVQNLCLGRRFEISLSLRPRTMIAEFRRAFGLGGHF